MKKGLVFTIILLGILCTSVAYISYSTSLTVKGVATLSETYDVHFQKVSSLVTDTYSNSSANQPSITDNNQIVILNPVFHNNDEIIYNITIANTGAIDAILQDDLTPIIWKTKNENSNITYEISDIGTIKAGEEATVSVRFKANNIEGTEDNTATMTLIGSINYKPIAE